nr:hypothetical protein [Salmonid herpesvirus 1]
MANPKSLVEIVINSTKMDTTSRFIGDVVRRTANGRVSMRFFVNHMAPLCPMGRPRGTVELTRRQRLAMYNSPSGSSTGSQSRSGSRRPSVGEMSYRAGDTSDRRYCEQGTTERGRQHSMETTGDVTMKRITTRGHFRRPSSRDTYESTRSRLHSGSSRSISGTSASSETTEQYDPILDPSPQYRPTEPMGGRSDDEEMVSMIASRYHPTEPMDTNPLALGDYQETTLVTPGYHPTEPFTGAHQEAPTGTPGYYPTEPNNKRAKLTPPPGPHRPLMTSKEPRRTLTRTSPYHPTEPIGEESPSQLPPKTPSYYPTEMIEQMQFLACDDDDDNPQYHPTEPSSLLPSLVVNGEAITNNHPPKYHPTEPHTSMALSQTRSPPYVTELLDVGVVAHEETEAEAVFRKIIGACIEKERLAALGVYDMNNGLPFSTSLIDFPVAKKRETPMSPPKPSAGPSFERYITLDGEWDERGRKKSDEYSSSDGSTVKYTGSSSGSGSGSSGSGSSGSGSSDSDSPRSTNGEDRPRFDGNVRRKLNMNSSDETPILETNTFAGHSYRTSRRLSAQRRSLLPKKP